MDSLRFQVRRWQASIGLDWTEDEIADVVSYLNAAYYGFPDADQKGFLEEKKPPRHYATTRHHAIICGLLDGSEMCEQQWRTPCI
jgi:hypothetical protein